jgi:hypothetical protein
MDEAAGLKATEKLPKALLMMLSTLIDENGLRSWQIYTDNFGISARLRFGHCVDSVCADTEHASKSPSQKPNNKQSTNTAYRKQPPAQQRRETNRKIHRAKRQRTLDEHFDEIEKERSSVACESPLIHDSPVQICLEHDENSEFTAPITPKVTLESEPDICDADFVIKCDCCGMEMTDSSHTCKLDTDSDADAETENYYTHERKMPKLNRLIDLKSQPYTSYCSLAVLSNKIHCNKDYYLCKNCMSYVCSICFDRSFRWNSKKCCEKHDISDVKYDEELNPK